MARKYNLFGWIMAVWLVLSSSLPAYAEADAQSASRTYSSPYRTGAFNTGYSTGGYQTSRLKSVSTTSTMQSASQGYTPAYNKISAYDTDFGAGARSSSFFHSVTAEEMLSEYTSEYGGALKAPRKAWSWSEPEDNPIGTVTNPVPVGEPLSMLLMALLGAAYVCIRRSNKPAAEKQ